MLANQSCGAGRLHNSDSVVFAHHIFLGDSNRDWEVQALTDRDRLHIAVDLLHPQICLEAVKKIKSQVVSQFSNRLIHNLALAM